MNTPDVRRQIVEAVRGYDLTQVENWATLRRLSDLACVDSIEIFEDEIQFQDNIFAGGLLWHITLRFINKDRSIDISESLPGRFEGRMVASMPYIERLSVDITSILE
jgi:hypothetical protein